MVQRVMLHLECPHPILECQRYHATSASDAASCICIPKEAAGDALDTCVPARRGRPRWSPRLLTSAVWGVSPWVEDILSLSLSLSNCLYGSAFQKPSRKLYKS